MSIDIREAQFTEWVIPCNIAYYDVIGAFDELRNIEWKQSVNIKVNDIVYIYIGRPHKEIKYKCIARKVDLPAGIRIDDSKFIKDDKNYKNTGRYMELELIEQYSDQQIPFFVLKENGIKSMQGPCRITNELSSYISSLNEKLEYEREVISIPAAGTIDLIYKYGIHAHPNDNKKYPYKKSLFYIFREKEGIMTKLYELDATIILKPSEIYKLDNLEIDLIVKERLKGYIEERKKSYKFSNDGEYKFYILSKPVELINKIALPGQNNQAYLTIDEVYSGNYFVNRCNEKTKNTREELVKVIEEKSVIEYIEINTENINLDRELLEGDKVTKLIEIKKRNYIARKLKLENFKAINGRVYCEVCGIEDEIVLDVHHDKVRVADMESGHVTNLKDLRVICANCHRKVHGLRITVDRLIELNNK